MNWKAKRPTRGSFQLFRQVSLCADAFGKLSYVISYVSARTYKQAGYRHIVSIEKRSTDSR